MSPRLRDYPYPSQLRRNPMPSRAARAASPGVEAERAASSEDVAPTARNEVGNAAGELTDRTIGELDRDGHYVLIVDAWLDVDRGLAREHASRLATNHAHKVQVVAPGEWSNAPIVSDLAHQPTRLMSERLSKLNATIRPSMPASVIDAT